MNFTAILPVNNCHLFKKFLINLGTHSPIAFEEDKSIENNFEFFISFMAFHIIIELPPLLTPNSTIFFGLNFLIIPFKNSR